MIEKVDNLTKKSFNAYTGPTEKFTEKNIIFGYNGRGKSSLALGVKEQFLSEEVNSEDMVRSFNKDYVDDNLSLRDPETGARSKNKIKGVIAHFSAEDVKSEEEISNLQRQIVDVKPLEDRLIELKSDTRKSIDAIHDRRKGTAAIQKKNKDFEVEEVVRLYLSDYNDAKKIESDDNKLSKIEGDNVIGEKIELVKTIYVDGFLKITAEEITEAAAIFGKTYGNVSIPSSEIVDWLNVGLELHEEGDDCKFCGGSLSYKDISEKVQEFNANEKQKDTKSLQALDSKIAELQNIIQSNMDKKAITLTALEQDVKIANSFDYIQEAGVGIANSRTILKTKISNIDKKVTFNNFKGDLQKFNDAVNAINEIRNTQLANLESQNSNKDDLVKGAIGFEIINDPVIESKLVDIKTVSKSLVDSKQANKLLISQIRELKQAESATSDFAKYISDILLSLNINLKLSVSEDGNNYLIQHTQTSTSLTISDISEGERNLLALLFFYYELFNDNEQSDFKDDIDLIIVDDPISSMDDINKMYILELMKVILALSTTQVFILTHSWDDFTNLCYGFSDKVDSPFSFYEIKKDITGCSLLAKAKSNISPYHHNFVEVYEFSLKPDTTNLDDCDIYHLPNIMRQVLEGFLKFKILKNSPTRDNEKEIGKVLFNKEWANITDEKRTKIGQLLLIINVNSHRSVRNPDEVLQSAKFLMNRIKHVDERHYHTNKTSVE